MYEFTLPLLSQVVELTKLSETYVKIAGGQYLFQRVDFGGYLRRKDDDVSGPAVLYQGYLSPKNKPGNTTIAGDF